MNCVPSGILPPVTVICQSVLSKEVQLGELDTPMTDLAVDVAWFDGGTIRRSLNDCQEMLSR